MIAQLAATATTTSIAPSSSTRSTETASSSSSPALEALPIPPPTVAKPIKLRAACNHCFSAKVRCDGNKESCRRCSEKRLPCVYSESRVGKVVGKRRKRPIEDSSSNINSQSWIFNTTAPIPSIPSPATTHGSDESTKRHCFEPSWTPYFTLGDQGFVNTDETTESLYAIEMSNHRSYSATSEVAFFHHSGLPTPALSPPQFTRYLSPGQLESLPGSVRVAAPVDPSKLYPLTKTEIPLVRHADSFAEDEETVCIKLLAHLKRHAADESRPRDTQLELLEKCNAALRRILHSPTIQSDYTCHLVLSSILLHLVRLCERLCQGGSAESGNVESQFLQDQVHFAAVPGFFDDAMRPPPLSPPEQDMMVMLMREVMTFASTVGDMLKRKPVYGFQSLGRHETFHLELEHRLRQATALVQP